MLRWVITSITRIFPVWDLLSTKVKFSERTGCQGGLFVRTIIDLKRTNLVLLVEPIAKTT